MKVTILRIDTSRGHLDDINADHTDVDDNASLWQWARQHARWARREAASFQREFFSPAGKIPHGGYAYSTGEESMVAILPESHPSAGLDYGDLASWSDAEVEAFLASIGEG